MSFNFSNISTFMDPKLNSCPPHKKSIENRGMFTRVLLFIFVVMIVRKVYWYKCMLDGTCVNNDSSPEM